MNGNTKEVRYIKPRIATFYLLGYNDYTLTLPFPPTYDTWAEMDQKNYENGRLRAAARLDLPSIITAKTKLTFTPVVDPVQLGI